MRLIRAVLAAIGLTAITGAAVLADAGGVGNFSDDAANSDKMTVVLTDFAALDSNQAYEGWLVSDDGNDKLSLGIWELDASGGGVFTFTSPTGDNLIDKYDKLVVTIEPVPDNDPGPSSDVAGSDMIPSGSMAHIRHVISAWAPSVDGVGLNVGARSQAVTALAHANLANDAANDGDLDGAKNHAEHVVNIIEGSEGANFGDLNDDGSAQNPGDGFGLLVYAGDGGKHAGFAMGTDDADAEVLLHGQHVVDTQANVVGWATMVRDQALDVLGATDLPMAQTYTAMMVDYATNALEGFDANGNGVVQPITGEGGAQTAYVHGQLMAQFNLAVSGPPADEDAALPRTGGAEIPALVAIAGSLLLIAAAALVAVRRRVSTVG
jgi:LPXTG-motif cell wall-anchored protein